MTAPDDSAPGVKPLLRLRLRWYALATARLLLRRWQALLLVLGLAGAANASVFSNLDTFTHPLLLLVAPGHGPAWRCAYLLGLVTAAALWAWMQRAQVEGGAFMGYACSLPFSARQRRGVDLAVLLLADSPLLLMVGAALLVALGRRLPGAHCLVLLDLAPLALVAQLALLERRPAALLGVGAACVLQAACLGTRMELPTALALLGAARFALTLAPWPRLAPGLARGPARMRMPGWLQPVRLLSALAGRHAPALRVALAVLYRERRQEVIGKLLGVAAITAAAASLMAVFDDDARCLPLVLLAQAAIALLLSGLFRGLWMAHRAARDFTAALPLPPRPWRRFDLAALLTLGLPLLAAPACAAWLRGAASTAPMLAGAVSYAGLLCILRAPQLFKERHAVVLSFITAGAWCAATVAWLA